MCSAKIMTSRTNSTAKVAPNQEKTNFNLENKSNDLTFRDIRRENIFNSHYFPHLKPLFLYF